MKQAVFSLFLLAPLAAHAKVAVNFAPDTGIKTLILDELSAAKAHVDIAMYSYSDAALLKKAKELSQAGIKVRVILDSAPKEAKRATELEEAGIDVRYVTFVMHHKFAVIDGPLSEDDAKGATVLTGSLNWSASAYQSYDEDLLVLKNEASMAFAFQDEFNHIWNHAKEYAGPASDGAESVDFDMDTIDADAPVVFTSANLEPVKRGDEWSFRTVAKLEDGVAGRTLIQAIDDSQSSVQIATAHFRRRDVYDALERALKRGVKVELVLDGQEYDSDTPRTLEDGDTTHLDEFLATKGASVKYKMYSRYWNHGTAKQMHAKYMIVDGRSVLTGSFNWSENAELKTFENLVLLNEGGLGSDLMDDYEANFTKISSYGEGQLSSLIESIKASDGKGPCVFAPIALTGEETKTLRAAYARGACRATER